RRTLREELDLGITCSQARRISLRDVNGVAVRDERRALELHLRKCDDCATFVGRRPRSPLGLLLLPTPPVRKLGRLLFGAGGAPAGTTVGGGGAIAAKVLAATAIGSTAVGVTVKEVARPPTPPFHSSAVSKTGSVPARIEQPAVRVQSAPVTLLPTFSGTTKGRAAITHANRIPPPPTPTQKAASLRPRATLPAAQVVDRTTARVAPVETVHVTPATAQAETNPTAAAPAPVPVEASSAPATPASTPVAPTPSSAAAPDSIPATAPTVTTTPAPAEAPPAPASATSTTTGTPPPLTTSPSIAPPD